MIDNADPCTLLNCEINVLVELDPTKYMVPGDFVVMTDFQWGFTVFDSWNDTKTEKCKGKSGTD